MFQEKRVRPVIPERVNYLKHCNLGQMKIDTVVFGAFHIYKASARNLTVLLEK